jgi:hypothetical protein
MTKPGTLALLGLLVATVPASADRLQAKKPIVCQRNDDLRLEGIVIETDGVAITAEGNCRLVIRNSKLISTKSAAVMTMGSSMVTLENVEVVGKWGSVMNAGSAMVKIRSSTLRGMFGVQGSSTVKLADSHVHGDRSVTSSATYIDGGRNTFHRR